jgi:hypothetical protein
VTLEPLRDGRCPYCRFLPPNELMKPIWHTCDGSAGTRVATLNGHVLRGVLEEIRTQCKPGER